jgi:hypothetical protein
MPSSRRSDCIHRHIKSTATARKKWMSSKYAAVRDKDWSSQLNSPAGTQDAKLPTLVLEFD